MDEIVFNDIYDKYVNPVWRTALYYSGNQTDAEEITRPQTCVQQKEKGKIGDTDV